MDFKTSINCWVRTGFGGCLLALLVQVIGVSGASVSVTPSVISNTYTGYFTLQVGGLTNGEPVRVENYFDVNQNGVLDGADMLMESYALTDGQRALIGGVTNVNVPGDFTGADGSITSYLQYLGKRPQDGIGNHLIRVSSPTGRFSPVTSTLQITNAFFAQSISGVVTCSSTNVPYAVIVILTAQPNGTGDLVAEVAANSAGSYQVKLPVGDYQVLAFRPGLVFSAATGPQVTLTNGATLALNLALLPATQSFAGRVVDSVNTNTPIPGVFLVLESASGFLTVCSSDGNGYFSAPVVPDGWQVSVDSSALAPLGYIGTQTAPAFDTTGAPTTNALLTLVKGTAMVYGTIRNSTNGPVGGLSLFGNDDTHTLESTGWSDPAGNYSVVTTAGMWWTGPDQWALSASSIVGGTDLRTLSAGQALRQDLAIVQATTTIHGTVKDSQGQPVFGIGLWAATGKNGINFSSNTQTDSNGGYSLGAFDGTWMVGFQGDNNGGLASLGLQAPYQNPVVTIPPASPVLNFVLYPIGWPQLDPPQPISPGHVAFAMYGLPGTNYVVQYSTNIADPGAWRTLSTFTATNMVSTVWDHNATNRYRFYRARFWP